MANLIIGFTPKFVSTAYTASTYLSVTFRMLNIVNIDGIYYQSKVDGNIGNELPSIDEGETENEYWIVYANPNQNVDAALDSSSVYPVQNKVVKAAIDNLQSQIDQGGGGSGGGITVNESDGSITVLSSGSVTVDETDGSITI